VNGRATSLGESLNLSGCQIGIGAYDIVKEIHVHDRILTSTRPFVHTDCNEIPRWSCLHALNGSTLMVFGEIFRAPSGHLGVSSKAGCEGTTLHDRLPRSISFGRSSCIR